MTSISWTGQTWNPVVGCSIVSKGCTHCYAMGMAHRLGSMAKTPHYRGLTQKVNGHPVWTGRIAAAPDHIWQEPLRRRKPTTWFVNSMGDLFHDDVPTELVDRVFAIMALCPQHTFQILTKRPDRMRDYFANMESLRISDMLYEWALPVEEDLQEYANDQLDLLTMPRPMLNVWLGTSVEDQTTADSRIPPLLATPAALRFISAEPLLGPVDMTRVDMYPYMYRQTGLQRTADHPECTFNALTGETNVHWTAGVSDPWAHGLDWVICGGESGPGARPMHPDWARTLRDQCAAAGTPFHFKQWGEWAPVILTADENGDPDAAYAVTNCSDDAAHTSKQECRFWQAGEWVAWPLVENLPAAGARRIGKKAAGNVLDGAAHNAIPPHAGGA